MRELTKYFSLFSKLQVTNLPDYSVFYDGGKLGASLSIIENSYEPLEAVDEFNNIENIDGTRVIYNAYTYRQHLGIDPSSGFFLAKIYQYLGFYYLEYIDLENDKTYTQKRTDTEGTIRSSEIEEVLSIINNPLITPDDLISYVHSTPAFFRQYMKNDRKMLFLVIKNIDLPLFIIDIDVEACMDSDCIEMSKLSSA